jgi:hypothetical protein
MNISFTLSDFSILLAAIAIILLLTSQLLGSSQEYSVRILVDGGKMRIAAIVCSLAFLVTIVLRIILIIS